MCFVFPFIHALPNAPCSQHLPFPCVSSSHLFMPCRMHPAPNTFPSHVFRHPIYSCLAECTLLPTPSRPMCFVFPFIHALPNAPCCQQLSFPCVSSSHLFMPRRMHPAANNFPSHVFRHPIYSCLAECTLLPTHSLPMCFVFPFNHASPNAPCCQQLSFPCFVFPFLHASPNAPCCQQLSFPCVSSSHLFMPCRMHPAANNFPSHVFRHPIYSCLAECTLLPTHSLPMCFVFPFIHASPNAPCCQQLSFPCFVFPFLHASPNAPCCQQLSFPCVSSSHLFMPCRMHPAANNFPSHGFRHPIYSCLAECTLLPTPFLPMCFVFQFIHASPNAPCCQQFSIPGVSSVDIFIYRHHSLIYSRFIGKETNIA